MPNIATTVQHLVDKLAVALDEFYDELKAELDSEIDSDAFLNDRGIYELYYTNALYFRNRITEEIKQHAEDYGAQCKAKSYIERATLFADLYAKYGPIYQRKRATLRRTK